jgi:hypothetical protein
MDDFKITNPLADSLRTIKVPDFRMPNIELPPNPLIVAVEANYASEFHRRLVTWINNFDSKLDKEHEVGVRLVSFGQSVVFHLHDIRFWNPSLIAFTGVSDDGNPVELIQHVSQISVLLMKLPRRDPSKPKRKIGFVQEDDSVAESTEGEK